MVAQFGAALIFIFAAIGFIIFGLWVPKLVRPHLPDEEKLSNYECGERPVGTPWVRFNIRFYIVAILFIIFDVEVLFIIPWAVVFKELLPSMGLLVFFEMFVFLLVLGVGLAYCWAKGHLEWIFKEKTIKETTPTA
ncbi:NADH-quinone oxidoreductase subunit A [bacterium]|nr:NADH-quinone oxidoreductase subunit A [bacterium]